MAAHASTSNVQVFMDDQALLTRIEDLQRARRIVNTVDTDLTDNWEDEFEYGSLMGTMLTAVNGSEDVPEQRVQVMYLSRDDQLLIPHALGIHTIDQNVCEAAYDQRVVDRYWRLSNQTYNTIYGIVTAASTISEKRVAFDAFGIPAMRQHPVAWDRPGYATRGANRIDDERTVSYIFAIVSKALHLNCDIRDMGALVGQKPHMRVSDGQWLEEMNIIPHRLQSRLKAYTMNCIAALNMPACGNWPIGAWVRSFGVCCGVLPTQNTRLNKEWRYVKAAPSQANVAEIIDVNNVVGAQLHALCLNILAMFGLLHLNKNHTFITGDANMMRICTAFINTLRTMVNTTIIDQIKANMEVACRTAAHPFGLGQTYWLAQYMNQINALAVALSLRVTVCPPLTQRLLIVRAAVTEWNGLPVGESMSTLYGAKIKQILDAIAEIEQCPPAYSELAPIYGMEGTAVISKEVKGAADALMPIIHGYAEVLHIDDNQNRDGLAQALSLSNVQRDNAVQTRIYRNLWEKYIQTIDKGNLTEFMETAKQLEEMNRR